MNLYLISGLLAATIFLIVLERMGVRTTLQLAFKGDIRRETQFLSQYGQSVCTPLVALIVWQLDAQPKYSLSLLIGVCIATSSCFVLKRLLGRVRPNREHAGRFLGPSLKHANYRESFPSSHSACAIALTLALVRFYPQAAIIWWALAIITAALRYVLDAHWPSDVLGGVIVGYVAAGLTLQAFGF